MGQQLVTLEQLPKGGLKVTIIEENREDIKEIATDTHLDADQKWNRLFEHQFCNGWVDLTGRIALFSGNALTDEWEMDENEEYQIPTGKVWFDNNYALRDFVDQLLEDGSVILMEAD